MDSHLRGNDKPLSSVKQVSSTFATAKVNYHPGRMDSHLRGNDKPVRNDVADPDDMDSPEKR
jgi:hypothetical protein